MKYDEAYCSLLKDKLTIYEVRDLNFDETDKYDSDDSTFFCPDDVCRDEVGEKSKLAVVNAKKRKYIKTPHFKDTPSTEHGESCPYGNIAQLTISEDPESTHTEGVKEHHFPTEFIPVRKRYTKKIEKEISEGHSDHSVTASKSKPQPNKSRGKSTNRTSVLEHIVECYVSNRDDKEALKSMPLAIGDLKLNYWSFFKQIRYFQDREGLIYWGKIKQIKDYEYSFRIDFVDWANNKSVCLYIKKSVIDSYRKRRIFLEEIRELIKDNSEKYGFFYGTFPQLKKIENGENEFEVYNAEGENIDHLLIRTIKP